MHVRMGNTTPLFVKSHGPLCHPTCPVRRTVLALDDSGTPVLDEQGEPTTEQVHDGASERVRVPLNEGEGRVTTFDVAVSDDPDEQAAKLSAALASIVDTNGGWNSHSDTPPAWVWSDWPDLERRLSAWYGCPTGDPTVGEQA